MAVQVAKRLGATSIVAAGRGAARVEALRGLGATAAVDLAADPATVAAALSSEAAEVDVVLDYLWGEPASSAMRPILTARQDPGRLLQWIQIGAVAGPDIALPSALLRQANLHLLGSGQGSASARAIVAELPSLVEALQAGTFTVDVLAVPLADVTRAWAPPVAPSTQRIVLVP
jgi:NADPH:quinone reductase-like Zn-dependent oxidoreductase